ncbi:hypothetical protein [Vibrio halioticoli]|uniref:hypothetical protein n=1 Tax=Vibrio halioticoli TaxID=71388 RepID=UPI0012EB3CF8|nr:hypothetical protein [Vibrio halioticoli]
MRGLPRFSLLVLLFARSWKVLPWTDEQGVELAAQFSSGKQVKVLAAIHCRTVGAITSELKK